MSTPVNGLAQLLGTPELEAFCTRFGDRIQADMRTPFHDSLDRYVDALAAAVANVGRQARAAMEAVRPKKAPDGTERDRLLRETTFAGAAADRFVDLLTDDPLADTRPLREELLAAFDGGIAAADEWPETVRTAPAERWTAHPESIVRMPLAARLVQATTNVFRPPTTRLVPIRELVRTYALAELPRRVEDALNEVARLHAVALAGIRTQLLVATAVLENRPGADAADGGDGQDDDDDEIEAARRVQTMAQITSVQLREAAARARAEWDRRAAEVGTAFERAVFSGIVAVDEGRTEEVRQRTVARREAMLDRWLHYERGLRESTATEAAALSRIAATVTGAVQAARSLDSSLERLLRRPFSELSQWLGALADSAAAPEDDTLPRMCNLVAELFQRLGTAGALLPEMRETAERMRAQLKEIPSTLPEEMRLSDAPVEDAPATPRDITLRRAPMESMFAAVCDGALPRFLDAAIDGAQDELNALGSELRRLHQAVDFNITAALRDRDDGSDPSSRKLVEGVLDRSALQLVELRDHAAVLVEDITDALVEHARNEAADMQAAVVNREFVRMRSDLVEEQATRGVTTGVNVAARAAAAAGGVAQRGWTAVHAAAQRSRAWTRERLGVAGIEREAMLESLDRSRLDDESGVRLPAIYQQLFAMDGVDVGWEELLVPREKKLDVVGRAFNRWQRQHAASVAVFGEKGSGKTTLVRMARRQLFPEHRFVSAPLASTVRGPAELARQLAGLFELDEHDDLDSLADAIASGKPVVAVLEDAHHLFERTVGGFDVVFDFLDLLSRTRHRVFWILTMDGYAWEYLDRILGIGQHFAFQVNTTTLEADKLERAIMARHEVSGYALRFEAEEADEAEDRARAWRPFRRRQQGRLSRREEARRAFFRELNEIAEGNIFQGMFYWLRAIASVEEYTLVLRPPRMMDMEFLEQMPLFDLHTIAAIVLHGGFSAEQHARVFQMNPASSTLHLAALADANLLFRFDDEYKINKVLYRPLVRLLRRRNLL
jgi:hypothetical protein